jgi:hypothetical protein
VSIGPPIYEIAKLRVEENSWLSTIDDLDVFFWRQNQARIPI